MNKKSITKLPNDIIVAISKNDLVTVKLWQNDTTINAVDSYGKSALFHAVRSTSEAMITQLLNDKPDLNLKDSNGWTPLHYAAQCYLIGIADRLIANGANLEAKDNYGNTPLWRATFASQGKGEMIQLLLVKGADPNNCNNSEISPKKLAETIANYDIVKFYK